ncbi:MAG: peptidase M16 [Candidatus Anoxymicrobium japonicum]|uniref:Peptidase M16 n=1 Tax=Candidatus Anoxymicrobium japonicum TaxID=2013648 RepID=A0A2N3G6K3_9ACTN|nr:MAG: peptidase M16 [Candidatus Anoxymicrobium japonicum]
MDGSASSFPRSERLMAQQQTFKRTELHSGVRVLSERMSEVKSISLGVWIDSGSRDESLDEQGLSHFLEHMLFKGTPRLSALEIAEAFDCIGADINAATGREHTSIYSRMLQEHLPRAIEIVMEMAQHSVLDPEELNSERQVVLEEINMHNDSPDELVHDHLGFAMWGENPIGHSVLGDSDVIKTVDAKFFREFYRRNYVGSRVVVTACGAVDHEHLCDMVEEHMRDLAPGAPQNRSLAMDTPLTSVRIVEKETEQAHIAIGGKGLPKRHPDRFALLIVDNLLGGSMSSRLFQRIREQLGLVYSIYSYSALFIGIGMVGIYAGTHPSQAARVISLIEEELATDESSHEL